MENRQERIDKIYTYRSPFELNNLSKEKVDEIRKYPHLCVSQTLVEGLKAYYGRNNFGVICTIDSLLKKFYKKWCDDELNNVNQSIAIDNILDEWDDEKSKDSCLLGTLKHNDKDIIKSIKYLIESEITSKDLPTNLVKEQEQLKEIYEIVETNIEFEIAEEITDKNKFVQKQRLYECYTDILRDEMKKYILDEDIKKEKSEGKLSAEVKRDNLSDEEISYLIIKRLQKIQDKSKEYRKRIEESIEPAERAKYELRYAQSKKKYTDITHISTQFNSYKTQMGEIEKIVIHGVHQFTPIILRLLADLKKLGIEVIAMFNYDEQYPEIYKTWDIVYNWTGLKFEREGNRYNTPRPIGKGLASIYQDNFAMIASAYDEVYYRFDHLTSFCDYVGDEFERAEKQYQGEEDRSVKGEGDANEKLRKIALMEEQFYAINGSEINELLKLYFPEQFSSRHFLTYPIGQFILSLYRMWDEETERKSIDSGVKPEEVCGLLIKVEDMKEALSLNIWEKAGMPTPLEIFSNLQYYFKREHNFEGYEKNLSQLIQIVKKEPKNLINEHRRRLPFFIYTDKELEYFQGVLRSIKKISNTLFEKSKQTIKENMQNIINEIQHIVDNPLVENRISEDEIDMVRKIQGRIANLKDDGQETYITNIKKTLGLYLTASTSENYEAEWIVRDFEQIDGGVLLAAAQQRDDKEKKGTKAFHYAGVTDENLLGRVKKELPWPLTNELYRSTSSENKDIAEICATSRSEYNNFLRYSLFYGMYFLTENKNIKLSYIKELGDKESHPYSTIAHIMGIKVLPYRGDIESNKDEFSGKLVYDLHDIKIEPPYNMTEREKRSMETCYGRYLWNHCLEKDVFFTEEYQIEQVAKLFIKYCYLNNTFKEDEEWKFNEVEFAKFMTYLPIFDKTDQEEIKQAIKERGGRKKNTDIYINNSMEFIYRDWNKYKESKKEIAEAFTRWLDLDGEIMWDKEKCKNCNQHNICEAYITREEEEE